MHASRSRTRALTVAVRIWIPLTFVAFWFALALYWSPASGATPTAKTAASANKGLEGLLKTGINEKAAR